MRCATSTESCVDVLEKVDDTIANWCNDPWRHKTMVSFWLVATYVEVWAELLVRPTIWDGVMLLVCCRRSQNEVQKESENGFAAVYMVRKQGSEHIVCMQSWAGKWWRATTEISVGLRWISLKVTFQGMQGNQGRPVALYIWLWEVSVLASWKIRRFGILWDVCGW